MTITLDGIGKRFHKDWVFRSLSHSFTSSTRCAIAGPNGSGKSTLLKIISGQLRASEGSVNYNRDSSRVGDEQVYQWMSVSAPALELIEEFTLEEHLRFHSRFVRMSASADQIMTAIGLTDHRHKRIADFSSGMKQRVKLAIALFSDVPVLLLDEPTSNLDKEGIAWFESELPRQSGRLIIIASNEERDLAGCDERISLG